MTRPKSKEEFRKELAESFTNVLQEKGLNWKKEWNGFGGNAPQNGVTGANYRGCNAFMLSILAMQKGYNDPRWVTMTQIMDNGGKYHPNEKWHLKKGSKATYVEYWYPYDTKDQKAMTWDDYKKAIKDGRKPEEFRMSTKYTAVFNATDIDGMPEMKKPEIEEDIEEEEIVMKVYDGMGVDLELDGGDRAYYSPMQDMIHLPDPNTFSSEYAFNATALHELAHATGHPTRLCRQQNAFFGTSQYAYEELVAEISACFMGAYLETEMTPEHLGNHKAYVQSWIETIREKPETLVRAIKDAQAAADYMEYKAGLITEQEYAKTNASILEMKPKEREQELAR